MSTAVQNLLGSFRTLSDAEKHDATIEILKLIGDAGDIPESNLCEIADELFQALDQSESANAKP